MVTVNGWKGRRVSRLPGEGIVSKHGWARGSGSEVHQRSNERRQTKDPNLVWEGRSGEI